MQSRRVGRTLSRPVPVVPTRTRRIALPPSRGRTEQRTASTSLFGHFKRQGYTQKFVEELIEKATGFGDLQSKQAPDPYLAGSFYGNLAASASTYMWPLMPQYPFMRLCEMVTQSNALGLCIDAYVTNIESYGWTLEYIGKEGQQDRPAVVAERARLEAFIGCPSPEHTFREIKEYYRKDRETLGNGFFECAKNQRGEYVLFDHIPGVTMRATRKDPQLVEVDIVVPDPVNSGRWITQKVLRRFRRFVQITPTMQRIYFKEFGDPRPIDPKTGEVNETLAIEDQATEVLWLYNYAPGYLYGLPRWIGQLPSVLGSRESEMVNLNFFRENAIPAMVVLVSGGALTQESYDKVRDYVNAVRGQRAMNRVMVLEATVDDNMGGLDHSQPAPRIDIKPMISERQQEGLFQDYDQKNIQKVRAAFRLPPIFAGRSEDYTRASAYASMQVAETQVFAPERSFFDEIFNAKILASYKPRFHRFKSLGPHLVDANAMSTMIKALGDQGALTPNVAIKLANQVFNVQIEPITESWGDFPYSILIEYVRAGELIDGLDEFIKQMPRGPESAGGPAPAPQPGGRLSNGQPVKPRPLPKKTPVSKTDMDRIIDAVKGEMLYELTDAMERLEDAVLEARQLQVAA